MSFESLSERLTALQESNAQLREFIHRLANLKFQPGSIPLDDEEDNVMAELCEEIRQTLDDQNEDFELLQEDVKALPTGSPEKQVAQQNELQKKGLDDSVKRAIQELLSCRRAYHKASLQAKENLNAAQIEERKLIARSLTNPQAYDKSSPMPILQRRRTQNISEMTKDEKEVNASSDVTLALRQTHDMMAAELSRSQFAHEALKESTAALAQLGETYSTLDTMLSASKNLIGTLLRSQKSDTWYLETAFWVLVTTICWLIFRRWLYGPAWWFIWFPVRLFFRSLIGVMTGIGLIGGAAVSSVDSSISPGITASFSSGTREVPRATMSGEDAPIVNGNSDPHQSSQEESIVDEVGKIIDEGGKQEEQTDVQRNPKKRMWEEDIQAGKDKPKSKDEL